MQRKGKAADLPDRMDAKILFCEDASGDGPNRRERLDWHWVGTGLAFLVGVKVDRDIRGWPVLLERSF